MLIHLWRFEQCCVRLRSNADQFDAARGENFPPASFTTTELPAFARTFLLLATVFVSLAAYAHADVELTNETLRVRISAAFPLDLLSYSAEDEEPSIFVLQEDPRQSIVAVFNWTEKPSSHRLSFADLKLSAGRSYSFRDVFDRSATCR